MAINHAARTAKVPTEAVLTSIRALRRMALRTEARVPATCQTFHTQKLPQKICAILTNKSPQWMIL